MLRSAAPLSFVLSLVLWPAASAQHDVHLPDPSAGRPLDHRSAEQWKRIAYERCSDDGAWLAWVQSPYDGDPELFVASADGKKLYRRECASQPRFTKDGKRVLFTIYPSKSKQREEELKKLREQQKKERQRKPEKKPAEKKPATAKPATGKPATAKPATGKPATVKSAQKEGAKNPSAATPPAARQGRRGAGARGQGRRGRRPGTAPSSTPSSSSSARPQTHLAVLELATGTIRLFPEARSWRSSDKAPSVVLFYKDATKKDGKSEPRKLIRYDLDQNKVTGSWEDATSLNISSKRDHFFFEQPAREASKPKKGDKTPPKPARPGGLRVASLTGGDARLLHETIGELEGPYFDEEHQRTIWMHQARDGRESAAEKRELPRRAGWELWSWDGGDSKPQKLLAAKNDLGGETELLLTTDRRPSFSRDASTLLVGVREQPRADPPRGLRSDEVRLDIWHWKDPYLQTMQQKRVGSAARQSGVAAYHFADRRWTLISKEPIAGGSFLSPDGRMMWWSDRDPYGQRVSWDTSYQDVYVADTRSGQVRKLLTDVRTSVSPSTDGRYLLELGRDGHYYCHDVLADRTVCLTEGLGVSFDDERWDKPALPRSYGTAGWAKGDAYVWIYDRFDIWRMKPDGTERVCMTGGFGRENQLRLRRMRLDREERHIDPAARMLLSAFDEQTMASGFYRYDPEGDGNGLQQLVLKHASFGRSVIASKDQKRLFVKISRFDVSEDLWTCDADFNGMKRLSNANPQQSEFRWGKAELVDWRGLGGQELKGILIKPDGFDPKRRYPMMVYFYERRSETLHSYRLPHPGTSPNPSFYVSRGYLWFIPDIHYKIGRPGQSALECIVPGVLSLVRKGFVDPERVGIAGHSWGGYQTAYLVTRTDMFAAAESGAPVSNMVSAYGGIRWSTGMSRMFQYEKTQSRIGGTLWEKPQHYIDNSPLFRADEVRTPLLMLHNDQDGAVPWYQGIEFFLALRRLQREAYMFNYNGEGHGLRGKATQRDWTRRMQEFFDHHLRGTPAPTWMREGVPYAERMREKHDRRRAEDALYRRLAPKAPEAGKAAKPSKAPKAPKAASGSRDGR
jgi:dienelactone hydrolase